VPQRQANIRLDDREFERLETAAYIHRRSLPDELRAAVKVWLEQLNEDPRVAQAEASRDPLPTPLEVEEAEVHSLEAKRKGARGKNS
jgi:hypothetical protein